VEATHAFRELRLDLEYGDYLALGCQRYRASDMAGLQWKVHPEMQWPEVDAEIEREEEVLERWRHEGGRQAGEPRPPTPWIKSVEQATKIANMATEDVRFEIQHYAKRNSLAHSKIKNLINSADFYPLACQIIKDKKNLVEIYGNNPGRQVGYRLAIGRVEEEWFRSPCYIDTDGRVRYVLSEKGLKKSNAAYGNP